MNDLLLRVHLVTVLAILFFKLVVLVAGVLITWMGYSLMVKGVTGEFKFSANYHGLKSGLASASPGLLFLLLGVLLLITAVFKDKPFETEGTSNPQTQSITPARAVLPNSPP
jgi:hypothetical protein